MRAGALRHLVVIEQYVENQDTTGQPIRDYSVFASGVWAQISPRDGRELIAATERFAEISTQILIRYLPGVDTEMRVVHDGVYYNIVYIEDPDLRHKRLLLFCKSGVSDE